MTQRPAYIACVWWRDAWHDFDEADGCREKGYLRVSTGLLVQDDAEGVAVAKTYDPPDKTIEHRTFIPRGMVKRVRRWKIPWEK